ncbi:sulfurtransferase TusA family protein [Vibrio sp. 404]|uniref:Sulfurtransferase TusA family protein n=1 Tax=Vibrio marinisediminis TaxID=2758441 RepID=A0A7W2FPR4_9VIBR|nr:sulfurtransferase TusA family protein [Vibrio marinisediminis]MBA5762029.1 sulfurtransferase TusA family protein [Vibrio marinisediminis]
MKELDLRDQRCPLSLLLAKRHTMALGEGEQIIILVADPSSKSDIIRFLSQHAFDVKCAELGSFYSLNVTRGNALDVRNGESLV